MASMNRVYVSHAHSSPIRMRGACGNNDIAGHRKGNSNNMSGSKAHGEQDVPHMRMKHITSTRPQRQSNRKEEEEEEEVTSADISSYSYMQRRKDEEKRLAERLNTHREYSHMKATNDSKHCEMCFKNKPTWRCLDCRRGGLDLCSICMSSVNCNLRHRFECISTKTGGFVRAVPKQETLKALTCACCGSRDADQSDGVMSAEAGEKKVLSTLLEGDKYITVIPWKCGVCEMPVGLNAVEHGCVAGNEERWFENDLLEVLDDFDIAAEFRTTNGSFARFCQRRGKKSNSEAPPPCDGALSNAMRTFRAMRDEGTTGDLKHKSEEFNFHLTKCPVCQFSKRALRMNYDGCFKLRQVKTAEKAYGPPIGRRSPFGVLQYNKKGCAVVNPEFQKFEDWLNTKIEGGKSKRRKTQIHNEEERSNCGELRAMREKVRLFSHVMIFS